MATIEVYTKFLCPYCTRAKALLKAKGASFEEIGKEKCQGPGAVTAKQRLQIALYSALTQTPAPDVEVMDYESAGAWAKARWLEYMAMDLE